MTNGLPITGAVLSDHVRSVDWESRKAEFIGKAPDELITDVINGINVLLE